MRPKQFRGRELVALFMVFGFSEQYVVEKLVNKTYEDARQAFLDLKQEALAKYKEQAMIHHPDRGGDETKMKELNAAHDILKGLEPARSATPVQPRPRPRPRRTTFWSPMNNASTAGTHTTSYGGGFGGFGYVRVTIS